MNRVHVASWLALAIVTASACASDSEASHPNLTVTVAGEGSAVSGISFPASGDEPGFVDGWDVRFERILVTVDTVALSDNPDMSPADQSLTGPQLAGAHGPWAVDMTKPGATSDGVPSFQVTPRDESLGKSAQAQALVKFQSLDGARKIDPAVRYAFGFEFVTANKDAKRTNLSPEAERDYDEMISNGWTVLYVGTASFKGTDCKSSNADYDFSALPRVVTFRFGFATPTHYKNCQNTDLHGQPFDGEEAQRGVQLSESAATVAQITLHVDHPFWNTVDHDAAELFFDQIAAAARPDGSVTLEDLESLDPTSFVDREGRPLPWRSCVAEKAPREGTRRFDSGSVPIAPNADPSSALRSYADYVRYQQSTQGHLNADGLCAVERQFPAPR